MTDSTAAAPTPAPPYDVEDAYRIAAELGEAENDVERQGAKHRVIEKLVADRADRLVIDSFKDAFAEVKIRDGRKRVMAREDFDRALSAEQRKVRDAEKAARAAEKARQVEARRATSEAYAGTAQPGAEQYFVQDGCLFRFDEQYGDDVMIMNAAPRVVGYVIHDDGSGDEPEQAIRIRVTKPGGRWGEVDVEPRYLGDPVTWVTRAVGPTAVVMQTPGSYGHVRAAAQLLADPDLPTETVYVHVGWRHINNRWRYLSASGALGADGLDPTVTVRAGSRLTGYNLPDPADHSVEDLRAAVRDSLAVLDVADDVVTVPVLAATYRAPITAGRVDGLVWLAGRSGTQKSEICALGQQHYGAEMTRLNLPAAFSATGNHLVDTCFYAADALLVVDEFVPFSGGPMQAAKMQAAAELLIRAVGNGIGRGRLDATARPRPNKPPRGMVMATGEDLPNGSPSQQARLFIVQAPQGGANLERLTVCQAKAAAGVYALAMAGYVRHLATLMDTGRAALEAKLTARRVALRDEFQGAGHLRTPDMAAHLTLGWEGFLAFAVAIGAITQQESDRYADRARNVLVETVSDQADALKALDPCRTYFDAIQSAIVAGEAHLSDLAGGCPILRSREWGWSSVMIGASPEERPNGTRIGWVDGDDVYLDPSTAYDVARRRAKATGRELMSDVTLRRRLAEDRWITVETTKDQDGKTKKHLTVRKTVDGERVQRVLHLPASALGVGGVE